MTRPGRARAAADRGPRRRRRLPPLPDASADTAVAGLALRGVPAQAAALRELHRVVKPDGELRFHEHVVSDVPRRARLQHALARSGAWSLVAGGCQPACDALAANRRRRL